MSKPQVLVMAGGTGGHIYPALSIAEQLIEQGCEISWLGSVGGLEETLVPREHIDLHLLPISGLRGNGALALIAMPFRLMSSVLQALKFIRKKRINLVIGFGGFASGPGGIAATLSRKPLLIHEQNAIAGLTNRVLAKFADVVCEAFSNTFENSSKVKTTGNPIRKSITEIDNSKQEVSLPLNVLIIGGSRGAKVFNEKLPVLLRELIKDNKINVWHQTGANNQDSVSKEYQALDCGTMSVDDFIHDMDKAYSWADIVICRAGALTVSELATVRKLAIFIPYPYAVDDHQAVNASALSDRQAAYMIRQENLDEIESTVLQLTEEPSKIIEMSSRLKDLSHGTAARTIVAECSKLLGERNE